VIGGDDPVRVLQDGGFLLDDGVGREPALRLSEAHRAAGGVEAEPDLGRRLDLVVEPGVVREEVGVVEGGGASREGQFGEAEPGRHREVLGGDAGPDRIEGAEPVEQADVLGAGNGAGERLGEVVVGVDEAGEHDVTGKVEHRVRRLRQLGRRTDLLDEAVNGVEAAAGDLPPLPVHGHERQRVLHEQGGHGAKLAPGRTLVLSGRRRRPGPPPDRAHPGGLRPVPVRHSRPGDHQDQGSSEVRFASKCPLFTLD